MKTKNILAVALVGALALSSAVAPAHAADAAGGGASTRPNILLIVADDMGYSDLGCFGGEIKTPNLDALAQRGLRATNFYVGPTCSPTRSMLLSGCDHHVAGFGNMEEYLGPKQKGKPGYEGHLNDRVVPFPKLLREAGYHTYWAGKSHMGYDKAQWPVSMGFERDFTLLQGGGSNWSDMKYPNPAHPTLNFTLNGKPLEKLPDDHFSSEAYADFIIKCADEHKDDGKPFFAYLSFQAVHSPFAAPDDWLDKYKGVYDKGYDAIRAERLARLKELGIVAKDAPLAPRLPAVPAWEKLTAEQQKLSARRMEIYAAMLANMDHHIGRVLDHLKEQGRLDNTLVVFISDNGAEPTELSQLVELVFNAEAKKWFLANFDTRPENWGRKGSTVDYGPAWAQVGSTPFRFYKAWTAEGGIHAPLLVAGPGVKAGALNPAVLHVTDLVPTFLEVAGAQHPSAKDKKLAPLLGKSLTPLLAGKADAVRTEKDWIGEELFGNRMVRQGDWKLCYILKTAGGTGEWELFNIKNDPGETRDLAKENSEKLKTLVAIWDEYAKANGVILSGDGPFNRGKDASVEADLDDD
ncbi:MAG TPA: arylsulfatase [Blastocatellia bacterium]|nr:arylsulfatase [Blastocatellia bacterium]